MKRLLTATLLAAMLINLHAQDLKLTRENIPEIVSAMTPEEKVNLVVGCGAGWGNPDAKFLGTAGWTKAIPRLGIPSIYFADGPQGVNMTQTREYDVIDYSCTFFLSGSTFATSWDVDAAQAIGQAIGYELKERGLDVILGPGMNLHRNILCGRNQEYYSEDPLLSGKLAAAWIRGAQSNGIATSLKHFAVNNQETNRKENDSRVGMRALRELYLKGFEIAVKEGRPWTVMGAYNYVNGVHACENKWLLTDVLRGEWGWQGVVMSDWDGVVRQADAVSAGCELIEPGTDADREALLAALKEGSLSTEALDRNVRNILELVVKCPSFKGYEYSNDIDRKKHQKLLRRVAAESMVLLKNEGDVLPLKPGSVGLYGVSSYDLIPANMGVNGVNNGVYHVSLVQGLREAGFTVCPSVLRDYTNYIVSEKEKIASAYPAIYKQFFRYPRPEELIPGTGEAKAESVGALTVDLGLKQSSGTPRLSLKEQAETNEAAIITLARGTGEAFDRAASEFELTVSEKMLIDSLSNAYHSCEKPVIVLLNVPAPIETVSWREKVDAILLVGQPGERAGESIADALTGAVAPSGRLADTWPIHYGDAPSDKNFPSEVGQDLKSLITPRASREGRELVRNIDYTDYEEGIYVGYRYFTTSLTEAAYPFGYGLSYTFFNYEKASVEASADGFVARVSVRNTGSRPGREVVQLYVSAPKGGLEKPTRELKGFAKTRMLAPGESETVEIPVSLYDLASWNEKKGRWETARGTYHFCFGTSADTMQTDCTVKMKNTVNHE
jgi:beta-glucosidase